MELAGVTSGELYVRLLCRSSGSLLDGVGVAMVEFLQTQLPSPDDYAAKRSSLRSLRHQWRRTKQLKIDELQTRKLLCRAPAVGVEALRAQPEAFLTDFAAGHRVLDQTLLSLLLRFYLSVEAERKQIAQWHASEQALCDVLAAQAKRALHLRTFAIYLENETASQAKLHRLDPQHPQGLRCRRAALDNIKPGAPRMEVVDVYKIEHAPLLHDFQALVASLLPSVKVKGLFCSVPMDAVEHCVAFGMDSTRNVFRKSWYSTAKDKKYAEQIAQSSSRIEFPKRFSRYSSFPELQDASSPYMALCRVAMHQVAVEPTDQMRVFPSDAVDTLYFESTEEYLVRHGHYVVPEFLIELRPALPDTPEASGVAAGAAAATIELDMPDIKPIGAMHDALPHPTACPLDMSTSSISKGIRKMKPELFDLHHAVEPPKTFLQQRSALLHTIVRAMQQHWDRVGQMWCLHARRRPPPALALQHNNQMDDATAAVGGRRLQPPPKAKVRAKPLVGSPYLPVMR